MTEIYAASLSLSQGSRGTTACASLMLCHEGQTRELSLEWPNLGDINAHLDVAEWLYSALSRLVTNYDEHTVVIAKVHPLDSLTVEVGHEA